MNYIITYFPAFRKAALFEAEKENCRTERHLAANLSLLEADDSFAVRLTKSNPIFIRHIMPVHIKCFVPNEKEAAMPIVLSETNKIVSLSHKQEFSVQCRIFEGEADYSSKDVEVFVGTYFDKSGAIPIFSDFALIDGNNICVISIFILENDLFIGFSKASENLNFHSDEYRILSRGKGREISRAENKLKEAIHKFGIKIQGNGYALDIGASPGGWSKVLADYGFIVYAVDPGNLNPLLSGNVNIKHFKSKIEDLNFSEHFEVVVNDMNVDPQQTAWMMNNISDNLELGSVAIVTLKLPFSDVSRSINESVNILNEKYEVISLKNLFHNRQEITAYLRRR